MEPKNASNAAECAVYVIDLLASLSDKEIQAQQQQTAH
jgi:hypothetical protein